MFNPPLIRFTTTFCFSRQPNESTMSFGKVSPMDLPPPERVNLRILFSLWILRAIVLIKKITELITEFLSEAGKNY
jgi:hypothetical protein